MSQVSVTIDGRKYRLACNEGEEARLESLAGTIDEKIGEMRKTFGEIGDQRLVIMAALTLADSLTEAKDEAAAQRKRSDDASQPWPRPWTSSGRGSNPSPRAWRALIPIRPRAEFGLKCRVPISECEFIASFWPCVKRLRHAADLGFWRCIDIGCEHRRRFSKQLLWGRRICGKRRRRAQRWGRDRFLYSAARSRR